MNSKEQSGGHSNIHIKFGVVDPTRGVNTIQESQRSKILFNNDANITENDYSEIFINQLAKLMCFNNETGIINMDFTNFFHRNIYADINKMYSIVSDGTKFSFADKNISDGNEIIRKFDAGGTGAQIFFINNKLRNKTYVLKSYPLPNTIDKIDDYMSLEFVRIFKGVDQPGKISASSYQNNYMNITMTDYEQIFNKSDTSINRLNTNLWDSFNIPDVDAPQLLMGCPNGDFYNDIIINLILRKLFKDANVRDLPFVAYHNFFVSYVNNSLRGFVLMDSFDGDTYNLVAGTNDIDKKLQLMHEIIEHVSHFFEITKHPLYEFTHTDLKLENIFYRKVESGYNFYVADFDKSSIYYNKIRFYNNSTALAGTQSFIKESFNTITIDRKNKVFNFNKSFLMTVSGIPTESIVQRYWIFPFFTNWDFVSVFLSMLTTVDIDSPHIARDTMLNFIYNHPYLNNALGYIKKEPESQSTRNIIRLVQLYINYIFRKTYKRSYDGVFSALIEQILQMGAPVNIRSYAEIYGKPSNYADNAYMNSSVIQTALLSKREHKLIMSLPAYYTNTPTKVWARGYRKGSFEFYIDTEKTRQFYAGLLKYAFPEKFEYDIYYNKNDASILVSPLSICNRWSEIGGFGGIFGTYLRECDVIDINDIIPIFGYFRTLLSPENLQFIGDIGRDILVIPEEGDAMPIASSSKVVGQQRHGTLDVIEDYRTGKAPNPTQRATVDDDDETFYDAPESFPPTPPIQSFAGGNNGKIDYRLKYLKYKKKYLDYSNKYSK